jgi:hypothetical protein
MYVAVGAVSFYGLLLTQGHADDLLEDVGQDVRGCTLTETQKSEALTSHVRGDVRADVNASQKPSNKPHLVARAAPRATPAPDPDSPRRHQNVRSRAGGGRASTDRKIV